MLLAIALNLGIKISRYARDRARAILEIELRAKSIENCLGLAIAYPDFAPYLKTFEKFGFWCFDRIAPQGNRWLQTSIGQVVGGKIRQVEQRRC